MKDKKNSYTCDTCRGVTITIDTDEGVTPFMLKCRATKGCKGWMRSGFYRNVTGEPQYEWRKPTKEEYANYPPAMKEHIDMGGLDIYEIETSSDQQ